MSNKESPKKKNFVKDLRDSVKNEFFKEGLVKTLFKWKRESLAFITKFKKIRDISKNNYELGRKHYAIGNFDDAIMRFKITIWMDPKHADGWYWLGASYVAEGKKQAAYKALKKALELKPNWQEALDMLKELNSASES